MSRGRSAWHGHEHGRGLGQEGVEHSTRYRFGPRERAGLYTFLELARDHDLLDTVPELRFVSTTGAAVA